MSVVLPPVRTQRKASSTAITALQGTDDNTMMLPQNLLQQTLSPLALLQGFA